MAIAFDTLVGLVERYSPSGREAEAVRWLVDRMAALNFARSFSDPIGNAVGVMGDGPRQAVLLGHIDTVPGEIPVRVEVGVLYGRGTVDAKGPLAAFVDAVAAVGPRPGWQLVVIGAVGEESDSRGAQALLDRFRPEWAVIGEPSGWDRVTLGYRGSLWFEYRVRRALSHTASGDQSACEAAVAFWEALTAACVDHNQGRERVFDRLSPTLREMHSDGDGFEDRATLRIGVRLPPGVMPAAWQARMSAWTAGGEITVEGGSAPAYRAEKNTPLVRALLTGIRAQGGQPAFTLKSGTSDMNLVGPAWGCPMLAYGPGDSSLDHTPNEHLSLAEYERAVAVLTGALASLTSHSDPK